MAVSCLLPPKRTHKHVSAQAGQTCPTCGKLIRTTAGQIACARRYRERMRRKGDLQALSGTFGDGI